MAHHPKRGERVVLSFTIGNPSQLATMLWNMRSRAVVDGFIDCSVEGIPQTWWRDQQEDHKRWREEADRRHAAEATERARLHAAIDAELERDPTRSDEEISALIPGTHPPWIRRGRDRLLRSPAARVSGVGRMVNPRPVGKSVTRSPA
jgi:hypothetical protein